MGDLILGRDGVSFNERLRKNTPEHRAIDDADDWERKLPDGVGPKGQTGGRIWRHMPPAAQAISRMAAHKRPTLGSRRPIAARIKTGNTNALEIGFASEMPKQMPLTRTKRKQRPTATVRKNTGWWRN